MVFKKREENGGKVDENINLAGRIKGEKDLTKRAIRDRELLSLVRKLRPHLVDGVSTVTKIMRNEQSTDQNRLKASALILQTYRQLVDDLYDVDSEQEEGVEIQPQNTPIFSLKIVGGDESKAE